MEGQFTIPLHFAAEFLVLAVSAGASLEAFRGARRGRGFGRFLPGIGFALLAVAQGLHGSLAFEGDGVPVLLAMRSLAFALLAVGGPPAPVHAAPAILLAGRNAGWALLPAALAATVAARAALARRGSRERSPAFAWAFAAFAAAEVLLSGASRGGAAWLTLSHVARAAGGAFLAAWLWSSIGRSIRLRFVATFVAGLLVVVLIASLALNGVVATNIRDQELQSLQVAGKARVDQLTELGRNIQDSATQFAGSAAIRRPLAARMRDELATDARGILELFSQRIDFVMFVDRIGRVLGAATGSPPGNMRTSEQVLLSGSKVVAEAVHPSRAHAVTSAESLGGTRVVVISAAPVSDGRRVVGAVVVGLYVSEQLLKSFAAETASGVSLLVGGVVRDSTLGPAEHVARAFDGLEQIVRDVRDAQRARRASFSLRGTGYLTALVPIRRSDGPTVGVLAFSRSADVLASPQRSINRTLFLVLLGASAIAALVAWLAGGRVSRPIRTLTGAVQQLRRGNLESRVSVDGQDEIGVLGSAFNEMAVSLQQTEKMKTEFLSNVSHELRTPLTPIKGYADIMRRKALPRRKAVTFLQKIEESAERLERIVEILVDFAAIEAGRLRPQAEAVPLKPLLGRAVARWRARAPEHRFVLKAPAGLPPVAADPRRLERIVDELLDNAVKFSPRGGRVEVSASAGESGGPPVRVNVRDEGIGVEPDRVGALFGEFQQLDGSETRTFGGLGLGLAYSRRIAQALGGDVVLAETAPGRGSTFSILLPAADTEVGATAPRRTNVRRGTSVRRRANVGRRTKA